MTEIKKLSLVLVATLVLAASLIGLMAYGLAQGWDVAVVLIVPILTLGVSAGQLIWAIIEERKDPGSWES